MKKILGSGLALTYRSGTSLLISLLLLASTGFASFSDSVTGGRAAALDGAVSAAPGDVFSLYYNPAGLADLSAPEAGLYYGRLFKGIDDETNISRSFFGWASPSPIGAVGLSYTAYSLGDLYNEETFSLGYAHSLGKKVRWGTVINHLRRSADIATSEIALESDGSIVTTHSISPSAAAWDANLGLTWIPTPRWRTAISATNIIEADVGIYSTDRIPRIWKAATGYSSVLGLALLEVSHTRVGDKPQTRYHGGIEKPFSRYVIRVGGGAGPDNYSRFTAGCSVKFSSLRLDYGFLLPLSDIESSSGSHQLSVVLGFGRRSARE